MIRIKTFVLSLFAISACTGPAQVSKPIDNTIQTIDLNLSFTPDGAKMAVGLIAEPAHQGPVSPEMKVIEGLYTFSLDGTTSQVQKIKLASYKGLSQSFNEPRWSLDSQNMAYRYKTTSGSGPTDYKYHVETKTFNVINGKQTSSASNCNPFTWTTSSKLNCLNIDEKGFLVWKTFDPKTGEESLVRRGSRRFDEAVDEFENSLAIPDIQGIKQINETLVLFKTSNADLDKQEELWFVFDSQTGIAKQILNLNQLENLNLEFDLSLDKKYLIYDATPQQNRTVTPGPLHNPSTSQIMKVSLDNPQEKVTIAQGIYPVVSPNGEQLAFLQGSSLMISDLSGANPKKIFDKTNLPTAYSIYKYHWNPSNKQILVVSAPDQKQLFTGGGKSVFDYEYAVPYDIQLDKLSDIAVYRIDLDTQKVTPIDLNWEQVVQDLKKQS